MAKEEKTEKSEKTEKKPLTGWDKRRAQGVQRNKDAQRK